MQTITFLQKIGLGDLVENIPDHIKLEEIFIELSDERIVDIEDVHFLSRPNRTIIRVSNHGQNPRSS